MPHSGGGGSHSGGSHSGGSHYSGGGHHSSSKRPIVSHRSTVKTSNIPFAGSRTFVTYDKARHSSRIVYAGTSRYQEGLYFTDLLSSIGGIGHFIFLILAIGSLILAINTIVSSFCFGFRKTNSNAVKDIVISDEYDYISEEDEKDLIKTLEEFRDKTGIIPAIEFTKDEIWEDDYVDMESFAYDQYIYKFDDEYHLLIVYSYGYENSSTGFNEFNWESMWGDNLGKTANEKDEGKLATDLQTQFSRANGKDVSKAIESAFMTFENQLINKGFSFDFEKFASSLSYIIFAACFFSCGGEFFLYALAQYIKDKRTKPKYHRVKNGLIPIKCSYCDGIYYAGTVRCCPYCGAPLEAPMASENSEDTTVNPEDTTVYSESNTVYSESNNTNSGHNKMNS